MQAVSTPGRGAGLARPFRAAGKRIGEARVRLHPRLYSSAMGGTTSPIDLDALGRVGTALSDPIRQRVLVELSAGPAYPTDLADLVGTSRANLSNHLACLRGCGLVTATAEGRRLRYELTDPALGDALELIGRLQLAPCDL